MHLLVERLLDQHKYATKSRFPILQLFGRHLVVARAYRRLANLTTVAAGPDAPRLAESFLQVRLGIRCPC